MAIVISKVGGTTPSRPGPPPRFTIAAGAPVAVEGSGLTSGILYCSLISIKRVVDRRCWTHTLCFERTTSADWKVEFEGIEEGTYLLLGHAEQIGYAVAEVEFDSGQTRSMIKIGETDAQPTR